MSGIGHVVLSGPLLLAFPIAAAAGAVTFLSPCVLPLVPGYLSYVTGMSGEDTPAPRGRAATADEPALVGAGGEVPPASGSTGHLMPGGPAHATSEATGTSGPADPAGSGRTSPATAGTPARVRRQRSATMAGALLFVLGFSVVFATEGAAFGSLGIALKEHIVGLTQVLGAFTVVLGLLFAGVFDRFTIAGRTFRSSARPRAGLAGAPLLGAMFGVGWTPCSGPTLSVVLLLATTSGTAVRGAVLMFAYSLGLGVPFLLLALGFQRGVRALGFARRHGRLITRVGGAMLVVVGALEVSGAWSSALSWLQTHWVQSYYAPL